MSDPATDSPPTADQPPHQDKFALLRSITGTQPHRNKTFYQHLLNVHDYLKSHNAPQEVCDAGLFHSIYGTELYDFHDSRVTRPLILSLIGEYAEELVHIFCTTKDRFKAIVGNEMGLSTRQARDLCCVEFANKWDQRKGGKYRNQLIMLAEKIVRLEGEGGGQEDPAASTGEAT